MSSFSEGGVVQRTDDAWKKLVFERVPGSRNEYREVALDDSVTFEEIRVPGGEQAAAVTDEDRKSVVQELDENHLILISKMQEALAKGLFEHLKPRSEASAEEVRDLAQAYQAVCNNLPSSFLF